MMATKQEIDAAKERYSAAQYESDSKGDLTLYGSHIHELDQRLLADAFCDQPQSQPVNERLLNAAKDALIEVDNRVITLSDVFCELNEAISAAEAEISERAVVKKHFAEAWLDAPDGPGLWWREIDGISIPLGVTNAISYEALKKTGIKWQRVIGPSE